MATTLTGQTLGGFQIQEELGRGAMGVVFKAKQLSVDRFVALKFLPTRMAKDEKLVARFLREARAAGKLSHPNIVAVHDVGVVRGLNYIAMEFIDGPSVQKHLDQSGAFSEKETLEIASQIAAALSCAHAHGILHRDIKPDNFLTDQSGRVRLADLGLARLTQEGESKTAELTTDGSSLGTPHYMPPEQCKGETADPRSDLYSLGVSMYVMATGKTPFDGPSAAAVMVKILTEPPRPLREAGPQLSAGFVALVEKLMAKAPESRFQNAPTALAALTQCQAGQYQPEAVVKPAQVAFSPLRYVLYGAGCAVAVLALAALYSRMRPAPSPGPNAGAPEKAAQVSPLAKTQPEKAAPPDGVAGQTGNEVVSGKKEKAESAPGVGLPMPHPAQTARPVAAKKCCRAATGAERASGGR